MPLSEFRRRLDLLELRYDQTVPPRALELARCGNLARYRVRRAAMQSKFFDRFAKEAQRAIQGRRKESAGPIHEPALDKLAADLRAARRQGLTWLARRNG